MKTYYLFAFTSLLLSPPVFAQIDLGGMLERKIERKVEEKTEEAIDEALDEATKSRKDENDPSSRPSSEAPTTSSNTAPASGAASAPRTMKAYANYDFIPGDKILFEDNFHSAIDGDFPSHWDLIDGQAVVNKVDGTPAFLVTDGNYGRVAPLMKEKNYLPENFTLEFDYFPMESSSYMVVFFKDREGIDRQIQIGTDGRLWTPYFEKDLEATYPGGNFTNQWHHVAVAVKNNQMKCYIDQYRVLIMPNVNAKLGEISFGGVGQLEHPIVFRNVRIAAGGGMNLIDRIATDGKIVAHGILFDVNKATIRPESMGTLNAITKLMKEKTDLRLEVGGHTDADGQAQANQTLSEQRAAAVKTALVELGVASDRLTTKGYGSTRPIDTKNTPESKANNRRVEFVKQ